MEGTGQGMFSRSEAKDILISVIVLSLVFAYPEVLQAPYFFLASLFVVGVGFMGHELSHRYVARRLGYFAEYRMWPQGIMLAIFFTLFSNGSFIFAAPGAVYFASFWVFKQPTTGEIGRIGISGAVFNMALMFIMILASFFYYHWILVYAAMINAWLAIFNLIPIGPLDGRKVLAWNRKIWVLAFLISLSGFAYINLFL
jgi:Zn-dependent protease